MYLVKDKVKVKLFWIQKTIILNNERNAESSKSNLSWIWFITLFSARKTFDRLFSFLTNSASLKVIYFKANKNHCKILLCQTYLKACF